jgi:hypothetical protein
MALGQGGELAWLCDFMCKAHAHLINNHSLPEWWPLFCLAYDLVAAAFTLMPRPTIVSVEQ